VFISGNGNDSSVWRGLVEDVQALGARTLLSDRAGLGNSALFDLPYTVDAEAGALDKTIDVARIEGPLVLVAHSYGGLIATLLANRREDVAGIVYVDAIVPGELSQDMAQGVVAEYAPQFDAVRAQAPQLAAAIIPVVEAYPQTALRMQGVDIPADIPVIVLDAEQPNWSRAQDREQEARATTAFVAASRARTRRVAEGSGHRVMADRPDAVVQAIADVLGSTPQ